MADDVRPVPNDEAKERLQALVKSQMRKMAQVLATDPQFRHLTVDDILVVFKKSAEELRP
jgi:hypothetical protein